MGFVMVIFLIFVVFLIIINDFMFKLLDVILYFIIYLLIQLVFSGLVVVFEVFVLLVYFYFFISKEDLDIDEKF